MVAESGIPDLLMEEGGTVIRYRTARDLLGIKNLAPFEAELLESPLVNRWLENLEPSPRFTRVHGSKEDRFESAMGRLHQFGLQAGMTPLDDRTQALRDHLADTPDDAEPEPFNAFRRTLIAAFLAQAGYGDEPAVSSRLRDRLGTVHELARTGSTDVYLPQGSTGKLPKYAEGRSVVKDEIYNHGNLRLPWVHDMIGWAGIVDTMSKEEREMLNDILDYIHTDAYQRLPWGYGMLLAPNGRFYAMGWSVPLTRVAALGRHPSQPASLLFRMTHLSVFEHMRMSDWYREGLVHLESYAEGEGVYAFPALYLPEKKNTYWVSGGHMGLEDGRRTERVRRLESTFWMQYLKRD